MEVWNANYDESARPSGMTKAERNYYKRLNASLGSLGPSGKMTVTEHDASGEEQVVANIGTEDYVNVNNVANTKNLILGTDNFGRDVLKELVSAARTSIFIGLIAGAVATIIGLLLGLLSGYLGGSSCSSPTSSRSFRALCS